jgi:hypothetical protein
MSKLPKFLPNQWVLLSEQGFGRVINTHKGANDEWRYVVDLGNGSERPSAGDEDIIAYVENDKWESNAKSTHIHDTPRVARTKRIKPHF